MSSAKNITSSTSALHEQIHNISLFINPPAGRSTDVRIDCPFTPDEIRAECCFVGRGTGIDLLINPFAVTVNAVANANANRFIVYSINSNLISGSQELCFCNGFNTWNPKQKFYNFARQSFNSTYRMEIIARPPNATITDGNMYIHLEFVRYRTGSEKN